jgi:hypothetical protein
MFSTCQGTTLRAYKDPASGVVVESAKSGAAFNQLYLLMDFNLFRRSLELCGFKKVFRGWLKGTYGRGSPKNLIVIF